MAHPFASVRQGKVEHDRVGSLTKGYDHPDAPEDKALVRQMVKAKALKASGGRIEGKASGGRLDRYARGGKVKKAGTNVNVIIAPQGGSGAMAKPPMPLPPPPTGIAPPMGGPPPGMGAGPPGMPPMMPHSKGGRAYAKGGSVYEEGRRNGTQVQHTDGKNDGKDLGRGKPITYAGGGRTEAPTLLGRKVNMATMGYRKPPMMRTTTASPTVGLPKVKMPKAPKAPKMKFATGGPVEAGKGMGPKLTGGDNGVGRLEKTAMQKRH